MKSILRRPSTTLVALALALALLGSYFAPGGSAQTPPPPSYTLNGQTVTFSIGVPDCNCGSTPYVVTYPNTPPCSAGVGGTQSCPFNYTFDIPESVQTGATVAAQITGEAAVDGSMSVDAGENGGGSGTSVYTPPTVSGQQGTESTTYKQQSNESGNTDSFEWDFPGWGTGGTTETGTLSFNGGQDIGVQGGTNTVSVTLTVSANGTGELAGLTGQGTFIQTEQYPPLSGWFGGSPPPGFSAHLIGTHALFGDATRALGVPYVLSLARGKPLAFHVTLHKASPEVLIASPPTRIFPNSNVPLRLSTKVGASCSANATKGARMVALGSGVDTRHMGFVTLAERRAAAEVGPLDHPGQLRLHVREAPQSLSLAERGLRRRERQTVVDGATETARAWISPIAPANAQQPRRTSSLAANAL